MYVFLRACVYLCVRRLPLFLEAQSMMGQQDSVSVTSPSGACLELTLPYCAMFVWLCVCLYVFLEGKTLQAVTVPETLTNKLICSPHCLFFRLHNAATLHL